MAQLSKIFFTSFVIPFSKSDINISKSAIPDRPDEPDQPDQPDKPDQPDQPDQPGQTDQPEQQVRTLLASVGHSLGI